MPGESQPQPGKVIARIEAKSMGRPESVELSQGRLGFMSIKSSEKEWPNQDFIFVLETPDGIWLILGDGMGGFQDTPKATTIFLDTLQEMLVLTPNLITAAVTTQKKIEQAIQLDETSFALKGKPQPGGGLVIGAIMLPRIQEPTTKASVSRIGDVHVIVASPSDEDTRLETLDQHKAENPNIVNEYIGTNMAVEELPEHLKPSYVSLEQDDIVVICSDGVTRALTSDEIIEIVKSSLAEAKSPAAAAQKICEEAKARGSLDDISCLVYQQN